MGKSETGSETILFVSIRRVLKIRTIRCSWKKSEWETFLGLRTVFLVLSFKLKSWSFKIDYKKLYYMFIFIFIDILWQFKCLTSDMQVSIAILGIISNLTVATRLYRTTLKINNTINKQITVTKFGAKPRIVIASKVLK